MFTVLLRKASGAGYYAMSGSPYDPIVQLSTCLSRLSVMEGRTLAIAAFNTKLDDDFQIMTKDPAERDAGGGGLAGARRDQRAGAAEHDELADRRARADQLALRDPRHELAGPRRAELDGGALAARRAGGDQRVELGGVEPAGAPHRPPPVSTRRSCIDQIRGFLIRR
ncbi:MAG TPA: carboxyl transferase domain-containing protein, partial [Kofleriaceae bacterium]|nr:carboxyl transferase domain-containing protein [Kofleriaceae bacterium]